MVEGIWSIQAGENPKMLEKKLLAFLTPEEKETLLSGEERQRGESPMRRRRRRSHKGTENVDRWLVTYADLITLLLAFFVMMYAISQVDAAKFEVYCPVVGGSIHLRSIDYRAGGAGTYCAPPS